MLGSCRTHWGRIRGVLADSHPDPTRRLSVLIRNTGNGELGSKMLVQCGLY